MINEKQARKYCKEELSKIKNYDKAIADTTQVWDCHHRTEIWWNCSKKDLIENDCYYGRKACELIFLTHAEHRRLHQKGKKYSEESRRNISQALKGKTKSEEHKRKLSEALKGKEPWNKGKQNIYSDETRKKMSEAKKGHPPTKGSKGMHWYNNGVENVLTYACPDGYIKGRLK